MKLDEFLSNIYKALDNPSCYLQGGFGQRLWVPDWYNKNYPWNKTNAKIIKDHSTTDPKTYGFDCVCLIKAGLWGFSADPGKEYGGAKYESNGVPDITVSAFASSCADYSTDFNKDLDRGELVFYDLSGSHIGVYIGDGRVIESTPAWKCGVQITMLPGRPNPDKLPVRTWYGHGHTKYIDYSQPEPVNTWEAAYKLLSDRFAALENENLKLTNEVNSLQAKIERIREVCG